MTRSRENCSAGTTAQTESTTGDADGRTTQTTTCLTEKSACPNCGTSGTLDRESVDIGVGMMFGPWGCSECRWSEDPDYDCSEGPARADESGECVHDQYGMGKPVRPINFDDIKREYQKNGGGDR